MTERAADFRDTNLQELVDWAIVHCPVVVALVDTQMRHLRLNAAMCRILGLRTEAGHHILQLFGMAGGK